VSDRGTLPACSDTRLPFPLSPETVPATLRCMRAAVLDAPGHPLHIRDLPTPAPGPGQVLLRVRACGVCRTDLHVADGELPHPKLPLVLGHEIVGRVEGEGTGAARFAIGDRVGVPWLGWTCGECRYCRAGRENLCDRARFTGYDLDGGYAEYAVADERYCFPIPTGFTDVAAAPLLCAGLIGYRALRAAGEAERLGIYGFGAAAHLIAQLALRQGRRLFAFTREGDAEGQRFARDLGVHWAGPSTAMPPEALDGAIIFAPVGALLPAALAAVVKGGTVVCAGIHMSPIPSFSYDLLWGERVVRSVANLTRRDGEEFFAAVAGVPLTVAATALSLAEADEALASLRTGRLQGAAVLVPAP
jgi:alcohol dehydrogenase, propanol-preferring